MEDAGAFGKPQAAIDDSRHLVGTCDCQPPSYVVDVKFSSEQEACDGIADTWHVVPAGPAMLLATCFVHYVKHSAMARVEYHVRKPFRINQSLLGA